MGGVEYDTGRWWCERGVMHGRVGGVKPPMGVVAHMWVCTYHPSHILVLQLSF